MYYFASSDIKYCFICNKLKYPRFYHCKHCNTCIYKLDHHCFFIDNCVGSHNQNYFLQMLLYLNISLTLSLILHIIWMFQNIFSESSKSSTKQKDNTLEVLNIIHFIFNTGILFCTSLLLCYQIFLINSNLTSLEYRNVLFQQNKPFKQKFTDSLKTIFGKLNVIQLLCPIENKNKHPEYV